MAPILRPGRTDDAQRCGEIIFDAFGSIAERHNFATDFPTVEFATKVASTLLGHPGFYSVVAESDGSLVGINFLDERGSITGVGPIAIDPSAQNSGVGRLLMQDVIARADQIGAPGIRLLQDAFHSRSFALYSSLGFKSRGTAAVFQGDAIGVSLPSHPVRPATVDDIEACQRLCRSIHGLERTGELRDALTLGTAMVVEHNGHITGYTTGLALQNYSIGESNAELKALIGAASGYGGAGILVPTENHDLIIWCLGNGLRVMKLMTLMTVGLYNHPQGAWMPSILY